MSASRGPWRYRDTLRLAAMVIVGACVGAVLAATGHPLLAPVAGWAAACAIYIGWALIATARLDGPATRSHATAEAPGRAVADLLILSAALAALFDLGYVFVQARNNDGGTQATLAALALLSVALSWLLIHTLFMLRYARLYYAGPDEGGIDFNQDAAPRYSDFAYFAFTVGMTFQVSDTAISSSQIRAATLRHALLSYLFGAVILAAAINLVAGLLG